MKLGIFPGLNGTVRSIAAAGPTAAMTAMLTGTHAASGSAAKAIGLVDQLVPTHHNLRWAARKAVLQKRASKGAPWWKQLMLKQPLRGLLAKQMREKTAAKVREDHYPAPFRLIDLFEQYGDDPRACASAETEMFAPLMASETSRNLRRVFRLSEMLKDEAPKDGFKPRRVHVIGAGTMGGDIAAWCVVRACRRPCRISTRRRSRRRSPAPRACSAPAPHQAAIDAAIARLIADPQGKHVKHADVVIEAIVEKLDVKQKLFAELEKSSEAGRRARDQHLLAEARGHRARRSPIPAAWSGLHFFNPVAQMPLVEVVRGAQTREEEVRKAAPSSPPSTSCR